MRNWPYQEMHLSEVSWLVCLDFGYFNSSPSKSDLQDSASAASNYFLVQQFFGAAVKLGFDFHRDSHIQKIWFQAQNMHSGRAQISMQAIFRNLKIFPKP